MKVNLKSNPNWSSVRLSWQELNEKALICRDHKMKTDRNIKYIYIISLIQPANAHQLTARQKQYPHRFKHRNFIDYKTVINHHERHLFAGCGRIVCVRARGHLLQLDGRRYDGSISSIFGNQVLCRTGLYFIIFSSAVLIHMQNSDVCTPKTPTWKTETTTLLTACAIMWTLLTDQNHRNSLCQGPNSLPDAFFTSSTLFSLNFPIWCVDVQQIIPPLARTSIHSSSALFLILIAFFSLCRWVTPPHSPLHRSSQWLYWKQSGTDKDYNGAMQFLMLIASTL